MFGDVLGDGGRAAWVRSRPSRSARLWRATGRPRPRLDGAGRPRHTCCLGRARHGGEQGQHDRRAWVPCFPTSHSPAPHSFSPVLSTSRCIMAGPRRPRHLQRRRPAAQGGVVGHAQGESEQADDGTDQALGLAQRQAEQRAQGAGCGDRQGRIPGLAALCGARCRAPTLDRLGREPDGEAAALTQAGVVVAPVRDLALLLGDMMAAVVVQLEGQGGRPGSDQAVPPTPGRFRAPPGRSIQQPGRRSRRLTPSSSSVERQGDAAP